MLPCCFVMPQYVKYVDEERDYTTHKKVVCLIDVDGKDVWLHADEILWAANEAIPKKWQDMLHEAWETRDELQESLVKASKVIGTQKKKITELKEAAARTPSEENALLMAANLKLTEEMAQLRKDTAAIVDTVRKEREQLSRERTQLLGIPQRAKWSLQELHRTLDAIKIPDAPQDLSHLKGRDHQLAEDISAAVKGKVTPNDPTTAPSLRHPSLEID